MTVDILRTILENHKKWLKEKGGERADLSSLNLSYTNLSETDLRHTDLKDVNLRFSNLRGANLNGADLKGANLDFSVMPLWCGDLRAHYDDKQIIQQLYHVLSHVKNSKNASDRLKEILLTDDVVALANEFHRVEECGMIFRGVENDNR